MEQIKTQSTKTKKCERLFLGFLKEDLFNFFLKNNFLVNFCFHHTLIMYAIRLGPVHYLTGSGTLTIHLGPLQLCLAILLVSLLSDINVL